MLRRGRSHTRAIKSCQRPSAHSGWAAQWRKCGRKTHSAIGGAQSPRCAAPLCEQGAAEAAGLRSAATRNADSTAAPVRPLSSGLPCPGNLPFRATRAATTDAARVRPNVLGAATCWRWDARRPGPSMRLRGEDRPAACRLFLPSQTTNTTATFGRPSRRAPAPQSMVWEHPVSWVWGCAAPLGTAWSAHSESNPGEKYPVCHLPQFWARPVCRCVRLCRRVALALGTQTNRAQTFARAHPHLRRAFFRGSADLSRYEYSGVSGGGDRRDWETPPGRVTAGQARASLALSLSRSLARSLWLARGGSGACM
jgi:hypothetical protein